LWRGGELGLGPSAEEQAPLLCPGAPALAFPIKRAERCGIWLQIQGQGSDSLESFGFVEFVGTDGANTHYLIRPSEGRSGADPFSRSPMILYVFISIRLQDPAVTVHGPATAILIELLSLNSNSSLDHHVSFLCSRTALPQNISEYQIESPLIGLSGHVTKDKRPSSIFQAIKSVP